MAGQHPQQVELVARQHPPLTGHPHLAGCLVDFQIVDGQNLMAIGSQRVSCRPTSLGATMTTATITTATNTTGTTSSAGLTGSPGSQAACRDIYRSVRREPLSGYRITQIRLTDTEEAHYHDIDDIRAYDPTRDGEPPCDEIWICLPLVDANTVSDIFDTLKYSTANIRYIPRLRDIRLINYRASNIVGHYALDLSISPMHGGKRFAKWLEDKTIAILALILLSPLLILVALWIRVTSGSPVFYRQERVGWNGDTFNIIKYRTMPVDNEKSGSTWGGAAEKPTIPLGRWLRRLSIDELPQFWNVLKGEMSVVGPRPERPQYVEQFKSQIPGYMQKHMVKAGITGWAQVNGWRGDTDLEERINYDLWYINNWSLALDLKIIALTALRVFHDRHAQ